MAANEIERELAMFAASDVADALVALGVPGGGFLPDLVAHSPAHTSPRGRTVGPARTVQMVPVADESAPKPGEHFIDAAPPGCVIVISAPSGAANAVWGGLATARAVALGVRGTVVDGRVRDLAEMRADDYPVFSRGTSCLGAAKYTRPSAVNVPVRIPSGCAPPHPESITVWPGDYVIADEEGVVVVPAAVAAQAVVQCRRNAEVEEKCMRSIRAGMPQAEAFGKWRC